MIVIKRYGGHYKVNGPPLNVPAKLDQVITILPHIPKDLQLYPVKLKRKLEYKSHYMYDLVHRDCVMGALTWLQENNKYYKDIIINNEWYNMVSDDELPQMIIEQSTSNTNIIDEIRVLNKRNANVCTSTIECTEVSELEPTSVELNKNHTITIQE